MKNKLMKFTLIIFAVAGLFLLASIPNFSTKANGEKFWYETEDEILIDKTVHDFEAVSASDENVSAVFTLTNNSKTPVMITDVKPSCGCTTPEWTKEPIEPGKTGKVTATYNSKNHPGAFDKSITIITNGTPDKFVVRIKGLVE